jgi:hypothetical protein
MLLVMRCVCLTLRDREAILDDDGKAKRRMLRLIKVNEAFGFGFGDVTLEALYFQIDAATLCDLLRGRISGTDPGVMADAALPQARLLR